MHNGSAPRLLEDQTHGPVVEVAISRPPVNALTSELYEQLSVWFDTVESSYPDAQCIVLTGRGRYFCVGHDTDEVRTFRPEDLERGLLAATNAFVNILRCPLPVVTHLHGAAVGGGLALAAATDVVVAEHGTKLRLPEVTLGIVGGAALLERIFCGSMVRRMVLTGCEHVVGDDLDGSKAQFDITAPGEGRQAAFDIADAIARSERDVVIEAKRLATGDRTELIRRIHDECHTSMHLSHSRSAGGTGSDHERGDP